MSATATVVKVLTDSTSCLLQLPLAEQLWSMAASCAFTRTPACLPSPRSPAAIPVSTALLVPSECACLPANCHLALPPDQPLLAHSTAASASSLAVAASLPLIAIATAACCCAGLPTLHCTTPFSSMDTSSSPFPGTSFVILSVSIVGILATSLLLLAYYLFLTRCGLLFFWRPAGMHDAADADDVIHHHRHHVVVTVHDPAPPRRSRGLEEAAIRRIPTFRYHHGHLMLAVAEAKNAGAECAVCLADFRDGERLRVLPPCLHAFHIDCIDAWLQSSATCPLCRAAVSDPAAAALHYHHHLHVPVPGAATHDDIAIDVISTTVSPSAAAAAAEPGAAAPSRETAERNNSGSMGGGGGDGCFLPVPRSLSMDSSTDKRFYLALQSILQQSSGGSPAVKHDEQGKAESSNAAAAADSGTPSSRRLRRSFFSFSQSRRSRSAVLPL